MAGTCQAEGFDYFNLTKGKALGTVADGLCGIFPTANCDGDTVGALK
jgi:hypothetical protein